MIIDNYGCFIYGIKNVDMGYLGYCVCFDYELNELTYINDFLMQKEIILIC